MPESMRMARAGGHGLTYLCVGASAGEMYRPNPKFAQPPTTSSVKKAFQTLGLLGACKKS
jgi:hypothetical protein